MAGGVFASGEIEVRADAAGDEGLIRFERAVAGNVGEVADDDQRLVNGDWFGRGREFEAELSDAFVG